MLPLGVSQTQRLKTALSTCFIVIQFPPLLTSLFFYKHLRYVPALRGRTAGCIVDRLWLCRALNHWGLKAQIKLQHHPHLTSHTQTHTTPVAIGAFAQTRRFPARQGGEPAESTLTYNVAHKTQCQRDSVNSKGSCIHEYRKKLFILCPW